DERPDDLTVGAVKENGAGLRAEDQAGPGAQELGGGDRAGQGTELGVALLERGQGAREEEPDRGAIDAAGEGRAQVRRRPARVSVAPRSRRARSGAAPPPAWRRRRRGPPPRRRRRPTPATRTPPPPR